MISCHTGGRFGGQVIEVRGLYTIVQALNNLLGDLDVIDLWCQAVVQFFDARGNLVETNGFPLPAPLDDFHITYSLIVCFN